MRRKTYGAVLALLATLCLPATAAAQYAPTTEAPEQPITTTSTSSTTSTTEATTSTSEGETTTTLETTTTVNLEDPDNETPSEIPALGPAALEEQQVDAGDSTRVTATFDQGSQGAPPPGTVVTVELTSGDGGAPVFTATTTVRGDGSIEILVDVPADAEPGVYLVVVVLPGAEGRRPQVRIATLVVPGTVSSQSFSAAAETDDPEPAKVVHAPAVERAIAEVVEQIRAVSEQEIVDAVDAGAVLSFDGVRVLMDGRPLVGSEEQQSNGLLAVLAAGAAVGGLALLSRRTFVKVSR